jgi:hypothetical protein
MKQLFLVGAAALILVSLLPDVASAQRGRGGIGIGGFRGAPIGGGGGFRGVGIGRGGYRGVGVGGLRTAAIGLLARRTGRSAGFSPFESATSMGPELPLAVRIA